MNTPESTPALPPRPIRRPPSDWPEWDAMQTVRLLEHIAPHCRQCMLPPSRRCMQCGCHCCRWHHCRVRFVPDLGFGSFWDRWQPLGICTDCVYRQPRGIAVQWEQSAAIAHFRARMQLSVVRLRQLEVEPAPQHGMRLGHTAFRNSYVSFTGIPFSSDRFPASGNSASSSSTGR